jgi:Ca2+:H+ antiporter
LTSTTKPTPKGFQLRSLLSINLLLIFVPVALIAKAAGWGESAIFVAAALAIVPLSGLIGHATEMIAVKTGPRIGGLINATLGNAAELIITIFALRAGLTDLVKASIVGSILGNLLLVLGFSLFVGGIKNGIQRFERHTASLNSTMVVLAFLVLAIPSAFDAALRTTGDAASRELFFSEGIGVIMIVLYALFTLYAMRTPNAHVLEDNAEAAKEALEDEHITTTNVNMGYALALLAGATIGIVFMSEALVGAVEPVAKSIGLSEFFVGIIVVPLIGNVAEHIVAVQVAYKNRMDLSMGISLGSSLQIALFVAPVLVFISLLFPQKLLLIFNPYELLALATASIVAALVSQDGESNWMEGVQLLALYLVLALAFFLLPSSAGIAAH